MQSQSKLASFVEAIFNTLIGLAIAVAATWAICRLNDIPMTWEHNFILTAWMTVISVVRSYVIRRLWNAEFWKRKKDMLRGHEIYRDRDGNWRFEDTGEPTAENWADRPCGLCGEWGNSNYGLPDPCLGQLEGVTNACCGHGNPREAYICFKGGLP